MIESILNMVINITLFFLGLGFFLVFIRLLIGPSLADRVIALDLMALLAVSIIATYAVYTDEPFFVRPAMILALLALIGTIAFAYYIEKRGTL